ncbi:MAG: CHAT domain-containing protein [Thermoanaerobaculia bacterium]
MGYLEHCYDVAESFRIKSYCLNPLALRHASEAPGEAERLMEASQRLALESEDAVARALALGAHMRLDWAIRLPEEALRSSGEALSAIEVLRDRQAAGSSAQAGLFSMWSDDYAWLSGRLLEEAGRGLERDRAVREAFRVSERRRARALLSWLRRTESDAAEGAGPEFAGLEEVREALAPDEALLSFQVAPWEDVAGEFGGGSWLLAVTRDRVTVHRLPDRIEVRRDVAFFEGLIARRDGSEAGPGVHLYRKFLSPALEELPPSVERLVLVPDDALHTLAFAALRPGPDAEPLGHRFELVRVPSATFWLRWLRSGSPGDRPSPRRSVLVLADPELPRPEGDEAADSGPVQVAEVRGVGDRLGRLPHARREGRAAVRALGGGVLLSGLEASEAALRGFDLGGIGLLHFAAHAVADEDRPERSAILLAAGGAHDGLLQSAEIAALDLRGCAVVLASCRSASGTVLRGEGVMSVGRAFFQAGAHSVIASLWPLRDDESAAQFRRFYRHLARGLTVAEALHAARREAIDRGEPAAAWAGLVLLGNGDVAPAPEALGRRPDLRLRVLLVSAGVVLLAVAVIFVRRRKMGTRAVGERP